MSGTDQRANPFAESPDDLDLSDFATPAKAERKPVDLAKLEALGNATGFNRRVSPEPAQQQPTPATEPDKPRRYTTGRDIQLNVKVTAENKRRFHALADQAQVSLSVLFERLLDAYERERTRAK